ncbi:TTC12 [Bugula neritina]|uniref:TTC12 n=1 Tax=Bugula neritina TaxID=10212 RepID=A0A7J7J1M5_BUGNE|nr:TTC12 [Bugula neritina]
MDVKDSKKLDKFLGNVDTINELIKNLNSENDEDRDKAVAAADQYLQSTVKKSAPDRTGVNRTVINKGAYDTSPQQLSSSQEPSFTDQDAFMKALEKDAKERADRKNAARVEASVFKNEGNEAFKAGEFEKAVESYTKGLAVIKDFKELWTNRAQAYIKLGRYDDAITDCDWAQRCDETFVKAYVLEAKAHICLSDYDKAIGLYEKAMEIDKSKQKMMREFIKEAELARDSVGAEKDAKELFESGAQHPATLIDVMKKVSMEGELPLYYDGGVRVLADLLKDDNCKTLFRAEGGLELYCKHSFFSRVMLTASLESLNREELDSCYAMFLLLTRSTEDNEESQKQLLCQPSFPNMVMRFLDSKVLRKKRQLRFSCLSLLLSLSEKEIARKYICTQFDITSLVNTLFDLVGFGDTIAVQSLNIINNMALDGRFKRVLYSNLEKVLASFEHLLNSDKHTDVIPSCVNIMTNLCSDDRVRKAMASRVSMLAACVNYLNQYPASCLAQCSAYHKAVYSALGLLMNITLDKTEAVRSAVLDVTKAVVPFLDKQVDIQERVTGCLSHILPLSPEATQYFIGSNNRVETLLRFIADSQHVRYALKCLTACTQLSRDVCTKVAKNRQVVMNLIKLLSSENEVLLGNACLCLSHCVDNEEVNGLFTKEDMKRLLVVIREANNSVVKQNSAILVGKLVKSSPRNLETLRELDGIGILHNSTKYYKL